MNDDPLLAALRQGLEVWEQEAADYWDSVTRSPDFLRRVSRQITENLLTQQRITAALQMTLAQTAGLSDSPELALLLRLQDQLLRLTDRIEQLEQALHER